MVPINSRLFITLPFLYAGIFLFLVVFQFSKHEQFSQSLGDLTLYGKAAGSQGREEVVDLTIKGKGMTMNLSAANPLLLETLDGVVHRARARSYQVNSSRQSITLLFQHEIQLSLRVEGRKLIMEPSILKNSEAVKSLSLPMKLEESPGSSLVNLPAAELRGEGQRGFLLLGGGGDFIDRSKEYVVIQAKKGWMSPLVINQNPSSATTPLEAWLFAGQNLPSGLDARWTEFWNRAYAGWQSGRYSTSGTWVRDGAGTYTPALGVAYAMEAQARGQEVQAVGRIMAAARLFPGSYVDAPFSGNIINAVRDKRRELEMLQQQLASTGQISWGSNFLLVREAFHLGPQGLTAALKTRLLDDRPATDPLEILGIAANIIHLEALEGTRYEVRATRAVEDLLRHTVIYRGNAYVRNERGFLDLYQTAAAGHILQVLGDSHSNKEWQTLAAGYLQTILNQDETGGALPRILIVEKEALIRKEGNLYPEDIYFFKALNRTPPGEISLAKSWSSGAFLKTSTAYRKLDNTADAALFTFEAPVGTTHHTVIQNVPPFDHIRLHSIRWRPDPQFQLYSDGYFYNEATRTLYVKNTHRTPVEVLRIQFTPETAAP